MNPQDPTSQIPPEPAPEIHNPLAVMQPGEQIICEIKRHPIGMFGMYVLAGVFLLVLAVATLVVLPNVFSGSRSAAMAVGTVIFMVLALIIVAFVFIANKVYWGNSWVVSSDSITQISQTSLFNKQSSQLSLGNLEDVTAAQHGVLAHLFKFGMLKAETAGESSKFTFPYCPNPNYYAQKILAAREAFEQAHLSDKQEPFQAAQPQPQAQPETIPAAAPAPSLPTAPPPYDNQQDNTPFQQ